MDVSSPNESADLPSIVLRSEMLQPGDVLLTHGGGLESTMIASLSGGNFSHAALVVNQAMLFESDGGVIGHKAIQWLGWGEVSGRRTRLARLATDTKRLAVCRHPRMHNLPAGAFDAALAAELDHSYGRDYSEMYRLVPLANLPDQLKQVAVAAFQLYERKALLQQIPGPFCSELVARVYARMGLALFPQNRPTTEISPNDLAKSNLVRVEDATALRTSVAIKTIEPIINPAEKLYPPTGDHLAHYRRGQRAAQRELDKLDELSRRMNENSRSRLAALQISFRQQIEGSFELLKEEQARGSQALTRWVLRLCQDCLGFAPTLAVLNETTPDLSGLQTALLRVNELGTSFYRCSMISNSRRLRCATLTHDIPLKRFWIRRVRRQVLNDARQFLKLRSQTQTFLSKFLA